MLFSCLLSALLPAQVTINAVGNTMPASDGFPLMVYELFEGKRNKAYKKPTALVFYVQGSEPATVTEKIGLLASVVIMRGRVILQEKRGCSAERTDSSTFYLYDDKLTRVSDHLRVIDQTLTNVPAETPVIVVGASEGGDIAAVLAQRCRRITHLILIGSGGGMTQKSEFELMLAQQPGFLNCRNTHEMDSTFRYMRHSRDSMAMWAGHPYKRWNSYLYDSSLVYLKQVNIPVLLIHGDADTNVPVASARALDSAFRRMGKMNLTYLEYPDVDHRLIHIKDHKSRYPLMETDIVRWMVLQKLIPEKYAGRLIKRVKRAHRDIFN